MRFRKSIVAQQERSLSDFRQTRDVLLVNAGDIARRIPGTLVALAAVGIRTRRAGPTILLRDFAGGGYVEQLKSLPRNQQYAPTGLDDDRLRGVGQACYFDAALVNQYLGVTLAIHLDAKVGSAYGNRRCRTVDAIRVGPPAKMIDLHSDAAQHNL